MLIILFLVSLFSFFFWGGGRGRIRFFSPCFYQDFIAFLFLLFFLVGKISRIAAESSRLGEGMGIKRSRKLPTSFSVFF